MRRKWILPLIAALMLFLPIHAFAAEAPKTERIVYGTSGEGRELLAYRYGSGENVLVVGFALHGFEDNFARDGEALVYTAQKVMAHLEGSYLPDSYDWTVYILPCMNPDGLYSGWTNDGPGRCTTTYLSNGRLVRGTGIDMNRCFPTRFQALYNDRNYTTSQPLACLEAKALAEFIQKVKGDEANVLIDVHGWYEQSITTSTRVSTAFNKNFPDNTRTYSDGGTGYLITYAHSLGYESGLLELPANIYSMSQYKSSGCVAKVIACVEGLIRSEPKLCNERGHQYITETAAATCAAPGKTVKTCRNCGSQVTQTIPALGHRYSTATVNPGCTTNGQTVQTCSACGKRVTQTIPALGHQYSTVTVNPGCTTEGKTVHTCRVCGDKTTAVIPAAGHTVMADSIFVIQLPTACRDGAYTYTCSACGEREVEDALPRVFQDVRGDAYYSDALDWCYDEGYIRGTGETTFSPETHLTRAMLVTILYRYHGSPEVSGTMIFEDVAEDAYYADPVRWAYESGIVNGTSETEFSPNEPVTRQQAMTICYRYVRCFSKDNGLREPGDFPDLSRLSGYAQDAAAWSVANGIIRGDNGMLLPRGYTTRAQSVTILYRLDEYVTMIANESAA